MPLKSDTQVPQHELREHLAQLYAQQRAIAAERNELDALLSELESLSSELWPPVFIIESEGP